MKRNDLNTNQILFYSSEYRGLSVMENYSPLVEQYLGSLYAVMEKSFQSYRRVFAFRADLRFPEHLMMNESWVTNDAISRFIESFKAKIRNNRQCAKKLNPYAHDTVVRYAWAREVGQQGWPHYHVVFLLNRDAFCALGQFEAGRDNMFNRLQEAWASALSIPSEMATGLVHIPDNPMYHMRADDPQGISDFFYRASYLCKAQTKSFGSGQHGFGTSRG
ncbi:inovirus Gp2 family protein [Malikia spinosa]|uniref:Inovirus Gp2 family protein n=1 Tax=Malikia spinosa TaxID=86180 RepID=A0A7C9J521_9BURK|nr:inovirus Gp2 family protein [Malikia spinosa]MYZ51271.1 inovirus Gp2 family protein [Malikia spinosa]